MKDELEGQGVGGRGVREGGFGAYFGLINNSSYLETQHTYTNITSFPLFIRTIGRDLSFRSIIRSHYLSGVTRAGRSFICCNYLLLDRT